MTATPLVVNSLLVGSLLIALAGGWFGLGAYLRRKYPWPDELANPETPAEGMQHFAGFYYLTRRMDEEREGAAFLGWSLLFVRPGVLYLGDRGLLFKRTLVRRPIWIPYPLLRGVKVRLSDRRRIEGRMALEVDWECAGLRLRSIFVLENVSHTVLVAQWLESRL